MGDLATVEDIERLMAQFSISATSRPTKPQIDTIILDTEHEVNTALSGANIMVPVSSPQYFVNWLGLVVSYGATAAVLKSMFPSASGPAETPAYAFWEARYKAALKGIVSGDLIPGDVPKSTKSVRPSNYFMRNPTSEEDMGIHEPWFKRTFQG
jgi:hypothetical protein